VAHALLAKLRSARHVPARLIGVALSSLGADSTADQLTLFEIRDSRNRETDRDRLLARTVDRVRARFGDRGILPARLIDYPRPPGFALAEPAGTRLETCLPGSDSAGSADNLTMDHVRSSPT